jgi:hypothetical protein
MKTSGFRLTENETPAKAALPAITRNGLSEEWKALLRNIPVTSDQEKELRYNLLINGLFYALHLNDKYKLMGRLTPVNFD